MGAFSYIDSSDVSIALRINARGFYHGPTLKQVVMRVDPDADHSAVIGQMFESKKYIRENFSEALSDLMILLGDACMRVRKGKAVDIRFTIVRRYTDPHITSVHITSLAGVVLKQGDRLGSDARRNTRESVKAKCHPVVTRDAETKKPISAPNWELQPMESTPEGAVPVGDEFLEGLALANRLWYAPRSESEV